MREQKDCGHPETGEHLFATIMMSPEEFGERALAARRKSKLEWYEREIEKRGKAFADIFRELRADTSRPYLATHENFEHYCEDRWRMSPRRVQQLVAADSVRLALADAAPELAPVIEKMKEGAVRELVTTPESQRVEVLRAAVAIPGVTTAAKIKSVKGRVIEKQTQVPQNQQKSANFCSPVSAPQPETTTAADDWSAPEPAPAPARCCPNCGKPL